MTYYRAFTSVCVSSMPRTDLICSVTTLMVNPKMSAKATKV